MVEGGAKILQLRHKSFWSREILQKAEKLGSFCKNAGVTFVINDRADYAAMLGASLHLGQEDLTPSDARQVVAAGTIIGYSTHNPAQMREADQEPADYLAFGPMFGTVSKERPAPTVGLDGLRAIRPLTRKPLVAIGGITRDNAFTCWKAGADSVAVIADLYPPDCTKARLRERMTEWQNLKAR